MSRWDEFAGAGMLLTRLPVARLARTFPEPAACVWAYPLVGGLVGGAGAGAFALALLVWPPVIAAILAVSVTILVSGGLHEDGLADTADGFGGGQSVERKLAIMRDSRIGSYGALALMLTLALRVGALTTLADPAAVAVALVVAGALGRGAMILAIWRLPCVSTGLAAPLAGTSRGVMFAGLALAAAFALPLPAALPAAAAMGLAMAALARGQVGGYTGDILGATEQAVECAVLASIVAR